MGEDHTYSSPLCAILYNTNLKQVSGPRSSLGQAFLVTQAGPRPPDVSESAAKGQSVPVVGWGELSRPAAWWRLGQW